jgi:DNA-binding NarL/FixJ family response regulator
MLAAYIPAYAEGAGLLREAADAARNRGDHATEAWADLWLGRLAFFAGDPVRAQAHLERALDAHEELGSRLGLVRALCLLGLLEALILDRAADGVAKLRRARDLAATIGDTWGEGYANMMLALAAADRADTAAAVTHARDALDASALGPLLAVPVLALAVASVERDPGRAARLLGVSAAHLARTNTTAPPFLVQRMETTRARAEQLIGAAATQRAWSEGHAMPTADAFQFARGEDDRAVVTEPHLTRREGQVAALVARGLTNREIGQTLHVSVRTVESHVEHALAKLDLRNRTELAGWVVPPMSRRGAHRTVAA